MSEVALSLPVTPAPARGGGSQGSARRDEFSGILDRGGPPEKPASGLASARRDETIDDEAAVASEDDSTKECAGAAEEEKEDIATPDAPPAPVRRFGDLAALRLAFGLIDREGAPRDEKGAEGGEEIGTVPAEDGEAPTARAEGTPASVVAHLAAPAARAVKTVRQEGGDNRPNTPAAPAEADGGEESETIPTADSRRDRPQIVEAARAGAQSGQGQAGENGGSRRSSAPDSMPMRVTVVSEANNIATGATQNAQTVASLASAIASDGDWSAFAQELRSQKTEAPTPPPGPVKDLRIQLNPASLGEVNARLRISGEQLMVEIRVDNPETYQRLSTDRDAIVASLRALGFKIDEVSIIQQQSTATGGQGTAGGREGGSAAGLPQGSERQQNGQSGTGREGRGTDQGRQNPDAQAHRAGADAGGVYI